MRIFLITSLHHILESKKNLGDLKYYNLGNDFETLKIRIRREFIRYKASKIVYEWKVHLEIFSLPQAKENSWQYLLLRTDVSQKIVFGCP